MRYIDPHAHMVSRTTDDYEKMALAGCRALTEPAFWAGYDRCSAEGFRDYFNQLTSIEPARARTYGIHQFTWLCLNPKEAEDVGFAREVMQVIPEFLAKDNVLGIGEIELNKNSKTSAFLKNTSRSRPSTVSRPRAHPTPRRQTKRNPIDHGGGAEPADRSRSNPD